MSRVHAILHKYCLKYDGELFSRQGVEWLRSTSQRLSTMDRFVIRSHLAELETIDRLIDEVNRELAGMATSDRDRKKVELLLGFTGMDHYGAPLIIYEIGDIGRFSNPRKLVSWTGLAPSLYQSGDVRFRG